MFRKCMSLRLAQSLCSQGDEHLQDTGTNAMTEYSSTVCRGKHALIDISGSVLRRRRTGEIAKRLVNLELLLKILARFEISVLLDAVYSITILRGTLLALIKCLSTTRCSLAGFSLISLNSSSALQGLWVGIICHPWAPSTPLPLWISTVARLAESVIDMLVKNWHDMLQTNRIMAEKDSKRKKWSIETTRDSFKHRFLPVPVLASQGIKVTRKNKAIHLKKLLVS